MFLNVLIILLIMIGISFVSAIALLFIFSGRISEQEERINGTCEESQAGFDLFN